MKNARMLAFVLVLCASAFAQRGGYAIPDSAELEKYPIVAGPLTVKQVAEMHLRPIKLTQSVTAENFNRSINRFMLETLSAGTLVYISEDGRIRYKVDCGNRLVVKVPTTVTCPILPSGGSSTISSNTEVVPPRSDWQKFTDWAQDLAKMLWGWILTPLAPFFWLAMGLLAACILIGLLLWLAIVIAEALGWRRVGQTIPPAFPPTPPTTPIKPVVTPATGHDPKLDPYRTPEGPAPEVVRVASAPTQPPTGKRSFVSFARAKGDQPNMMRWHGMDIHNFERGEDGVHTLRFTHHT